ncbi:MAG: acyl-CoA synthetase FdrA [Paracoccaceae bacterium]|nr:acyl-CoA synthetase FdrA [Paracoccaceae bacterium]
MKATVINEIRTGLYLDSVSLMRISRTIAGLEGVEEAALMMASPSNRQIMANADLLNSSSDDAGGGDLIVGIRAQSKIAGEEALAEAVRLLDQPAERSAGEANQWQPRSVRAALKAAPKHQLVLISVPGDFAVSEARKAINQGCHVMIFSDNVDLADEVLLKQEARDKGCLIMGPDCGTAIINGTPLAFANKVAKGDIGIVGASGTGIQEVSCLIDVGGKGISQAVGVGGRDLKDAVGGISTLMAIDALDRDADTKHIVIISKPPSHSVQKRILERVGASEKNFTICFVGADECELPGNAKLVSTLRGAALDALGENSVSDGFDAVAVASSLPEVTGKILGLYTGGTLCAEAQVILTLAGEAVSSNAAIPGVLGLDDEEDTHRLIDLGADEYTKGKPHPMIDPTVRFGAFTEALADKSVGLVLLDFVIGYGSHDDPAGQLTEFLSNCAGDHPILIASVTGTELDPQVRSRQLAKLEQAGIIVAPSNADAVEIALGAIGKSAGMIA